MNKLILNGLGIGVAFILIAMGLIFRMDVMITVCCVVMMIFCGLNLMSILGSNCYVVLLDKDKSNIMSVREGSYYVVNDKDSNKPVTKLTFEGVKQSFYFPKESVFISDFGFKKKIVYGILDGQEFAPIKVDVLLEEGKGIRLVKSNMLAYLYQSDSARRMSIKTKDSLMVYGMIGIFIMVSISAIVTLYGAGKLEFVANSLSGLQGLTNSIDKLVEFLPNLLEKLSGVVSSGADSIVDGVTNPP